MRPYFFDGGHDHLRLVRILAAGLFHIDVLAGLHGEQRRRRVPEVRRGDEDGVERLVVEEGAEILHALAGRALLVGDRFHAAFEPLRIHLGEIGDLDVGHLRAAR